MPRPVPPVMVPTWKAPTGRRADRSGLSPDVLTGPKNCTAASLLDVIRYTMPYDAAGNLPEA